MTELARLQLILAKRQVAYDVAHAYGDVGELEHARQALTEAIDRLNEARNVSDKPNELPFHTAGLRRGDRFVMSNISDPTVAKVDLCALAERVLGLRCAKHRGRERYTLRRHKSNAAGGDYYGGIVASGLTAAELRAKVAERATADVERAATAWAAAYEKQQELPARQAEEREALERRQEADRARAESDLDEAERVVDAAKALLAEVRAALGEAAT